MASKKKQTEKKVAKPRKKTATKVVAPPVVDLPNDDFSTNSDKFAFRHSVPDFIEPEQPLEEVVEEIVEEIVEEVIEEIVEEVIEEVVEEIVEEEPIPSTHFVVATPSVQVAETLEVPKNFINFNISDAISKSIANKFGINPKQIDIILTGNNDDIEISFARIYLSGEDVARLSIGV